MRSHQRFLDFGRRKVCGGKEANNMASGEVLVRTKEDCFIGVFSN